MLELVGLDVRFGAVHACDSIDLSVEQGEVVGVVGPNGSGKTTLFRAICGEVRSSGGSVMWFGRDITRWSTDRIARSGLVRTFQQSMTFPSATVRENLRMATKCGQGRRFRKPHRQGRCDLPTGADDLLRFTGLTEVASTSAGGLPTGVLRMVGIALALVTAPAMLMLDEPAAGLSTADTAQLDSLLRRVHTAGVTLVIVDHDMSFLLPLCERLVVLNAGKKLIEGEPQEVLRHREVVRVYLGERFNEGKTRSGLRERPA
jgi:branched-chain amino acid transport system ATP-binding protein